MSEYKRLTIRVDNGLDEIYYPLQKDIEGAYDILALAKYSEEGDGEETNILLDISSRLAQFEDTGSPEEFSELKESTQWMPIEKGEPYEKSCHYLVLSKMNWAHGGTWEDNNGDARRNMAVAYFDCTGKFNVPYVTHWRPLSLPPEEVMKKLEDKA